MKTELHGVPAEFVESVWFDVAPLLQMAIDQAGETDLERTLARLKSRDQQLWVAVNEDNDAIVAALTTEVVSYDLRKIVRLVHLGGCDLPEIARHLEWIGEWALAHGATRIEAYCRPGVTRTLAANGFRKRLDVIEWDLRRKLT